MSGWVRLTGGEIWTVERDGAEGIVMRLTGRVWAYVVTRDETTIATGHADNLIDAQAAVEVALA